ncbi:hypothetical protein [Chthoniobacter flavus]|nr:hypothetical protein [Chthoniobacter flavus]
MVGAYKSFFLSDRPQAITVLVTRPAWAHALLDAIAAGKIPRTDITAFHARQIHNLGDPELTKRLTEVWGDLRESPEGIKQLIAKLRTFLTPEAIAKADPHAGRQVFAGICATSHTLYGEGGKIGPDLTGANRDNLDYLLENIADPSAVVAPDFRLSIITLKDGRVLSGMITTKNERTLTLRTMTDVQTVERAEVDKITESPLSMMPEGPPRRLYSTTRRSISSAISWVTSRYPCRRRNESDPLECCSVSALTPSIPPRKYRARPRHPWEGRLPSHPAPRSGAPIARALRAIGFFGRRLGSHRSQGLLLLRTETPQKDADSA